MAVTKISNSGIKTGVLKYDSMLAGNAAYIPTAFESIASQTLGSNTSSVTFSSISSDYQHLQLRYLIRDTNGAIVFIRFNGDTTAGNYVSHTFTAYGPGGIGSNAYTSSQTYIRLEDTPYLATNMWTAGVIDVHDYGSTTKNKTIQNFNGYDTNNTDDQAIVLSSGLWLSTSAITSVTFGVSGGNFTTGSVFSLYGIKA
jgi:hypothetical protein